MPKIISNQKESFDQFLNDAKNLQTKIGFFGGRYFVYKNETFCLNDVVYTLTKLKQEYNSENKIDTVVKKIQLIDKKLDDAKEEDQARHPLKKILSLITRALGNLFYKRDNVLNEIQKESPIYCINGERNKEFYQNLQYNLIWEDETSPPLSLVQFLREKFSFVGFSNKIFSGKPVDIQKSISLKLIPDTTIDSFKIEQELTLKKNNEGEKHPSATEIFIRYNPNLSSEDFLGKFNNAIKDRTVTTKNDI